MSPSTLFLKKKRENGIIQTYTHFNYRVGSMVKVTCETDFCAATVEFKNLADILSMQVAAMPALNLESLLTQKLIVDGNETVQSYLNHKKEILKENIAIADFVRWELK